MAGHNKFGFALANGIVGACSGEHRLWRSKVSHTTLLHHLLLLFQSKHFPLMVTNYDINEDGVDELVTGWTSGKVDIRNPDTGQILFKDSFSSPVAGIAKVCSIYTVHVGASSCYSATVYFQLVSVYMHTHSM